MNRSLTLYHRAGCHLCEHMLAELYALHGAELPITLVDVGGDTALRVRYGLEVPVLMGGGGGSVQRQAGSYAPGRISRRRLTPGVNPYNWVGTGLRPVRSP